MSNTRQTLLNNPTGIQKLESNIIRIKELCIVYLMRPKQRSDAYEEFAKLTGYDSTQKDGGEKYLAEVRRLSRKTMSFENSYDGTYNANGFKCCTEEYIFVHFQQLTGEDLSNSPILTKFLRVSLMASHATLLQNKLYAEDFSDELKCFAEYIKNNLNTMKQIRPGNIITNIITPSASAGAILMDEIANLLNVIEEQYTDLYIPKEETASENLFVAQVKELCTKFKEYIESKKSKDDAQAQFKLTFIENMLKNIYYVDENIRTIRENQAFKAALTKHHSSFAETFSLFVPMTNKYYPTTDKYYNTLLKAANNLLARREHYKSLTPPSPTP